MLAHVQSRKVDPGVDPVNVFSAGRNACEFSKSHGGRRSGRNAHISFKLAWRSAREFSIARRTENGAQYQSECQHLSQSGMRANFQNHKADGKVGLASAEILTCIKIKGLIARVFSKSQGSLRSGPLSLPAFWRSAFAQIITSLLPFSLVVIYMFGIFKLGELFDNDSWRCAVYFVGLMVKVIGNTGKLVLLQDEHEPMWIVESTSDIYEYVTTLLPRILLFCVRDPNVAGKVALLSLVIELMVRNRLREQTNKQTNKQTHVTTKPSRYDRKIALRRRNCVTTNKNAVRRTNRDTTKIMGLRRTQIAYNEQSRYD